MEIKVLCEDTHCIYNYDCSECERGELLKVKGKSLTVNIIRGVCQEREEEKYRLTKIPRGIIKGE